MIFTVLKDVRCSHCGGRIEVPFFDDEELGRVVGDAACLNCLKPHILPSEPYYVFVNQFCENYDGGK